MRIVIDLQGAQGASRHRGIGRYSLALARAMVRNRGQHEILIALNGLFPESIEPIRAAFSGVLDQRDIHVWHAIGPVHPLDPANVWRRKAAEQIRHSFLSSLCPDVVHITSIFEGFGDDAIHTVEPKSYGTAVTLYDLIPLVQGDSYLKSNPTYEAFYRERLAHLKHSNLLLAISEFSRHEGIEYLGVEPANVFNISAATEPHFKKMQLSKAAEDALRADFGLRRPFLMYSGATDERKNHLRLIEAFSLLPAELRQKYQLAIVGHLPADHRERFEKHAKACGLKAADVVITGRVTDDQMTKLYNLCELFVFPSWHEGFGLPALEAMSCGAPVIASNTSSLPEVIGRRDMLFDPYDARSISQKMADVLLDAPLRAALVDHGLEQAKQFSWDRSAKVALAAFETLATDKARHARPNARRLDASLTSRLIARIADISEPSPEKTGWVKFAEAIALSFPLPGEERLLVDISELAFRDAKSGIQRVVRSVLAEMLSNPPIGFRIEPVYAIQHEPGYRYARRFTARFLGKADDGVVDEPIDLRNGDVFLGLDLQHHVVLQQAGYYAHLRRVGVRTHFVIYDLLPVLRPEVFPEGTEEIHRRWLETLAEMDGVLCISRAVADEMLEWLDVFGPSRGRPLRVDWFHLGADVDRSVPTRGMPADAERVLGTLSSRQTFLSVGTIEPRKGHLQTLLAFEMLWSQGVDINLVLVGKVGWNVETLAESMRNHPESGKRLFWLQGISDEYLEKIYASSDCLIAASEGEGFGLPLIEAAQHQLPIIARDIPVFREVAGACALYFSGSDPKVLAQKLERWLQLSRNGDALNSAAMPLLTWSQSTQQIVDVINGERRYKEWIPDGVRRFWGSDHRLGSEVGRRIGRHMTSTGSSGYLVYGPYAALPPGRYRVEIEGSVETNPAGKAYVDVVVNQGKSVLVKKTLPEQGELSRLATLVVVLDAPCSDFEIRIWTCSKTKAEIAMMSIAALDDESEPVAVAVDARSVETVPRAPQGLISVTSVG